MQLFIFIIVISNKMFTNFPTFIYLTYTEAQGNFISVYNENIIVKFWIIEYGSQFHWYV